MLPNDPLLPPAAWPGVRAAYRFAASPPPGRSASLVLSFRFDPEPADGDEEARQRAREALLRYATIAAQLADPETGLVVAQSVLPADGGTVGDGAAIRAELAAFAGRVVAQLQAALAGGTAAAEALEIPIPLDPTGLAGRTDDVFPVAVRLTLSRTPERVHPQARDWTPGAVSASMEIPPELDPPDAGLAGFAAGFEAAFAGFDGADGAARLAVRSGAPGSAAPAGSPSPWGVRWSSAHGIHAAFRRGGAACFAPAPLGTRPVDGTARVPAFDPATLEPAYESRTFSGVELDGWAGAYLAAMDEALSPATAAAIAVLDAAAYRALAEIRAELARTLARGLVPVFPAHPCDPDAARDRFEQGVRASLSAACTVSCIVQVPADVTAAGAAGSGAAAPRFSGSVAVPGADGATEGGHTLGGGTLALRATTPESPVFLTFAVAAAQPVRAARLDLDPRYRARFVERLPDGPEAAYGHAPSEWLRFVLEAPGDALDLPLGAVSVPVPLRAVPAAPVPLEQRAEQSPDGGAGTAADPPLLWDYTATVALHGLAAQDQLWVSVAYNLPLGGPAPQGPPPAAEPAPPGALFEALASFTAAWPVLRPHVAALPRALSGGAGSPAPARVVAALLEQALPVSRAWSALLAAGGGEPAPAPPPAEEVPPPVGDTFVVSFADAFTAGVLRVFARAGAADEAAGEGGPAEVVWPLIDGRANGPPGPAGDGAPDATGGWLAADYVYAPPSDGPPGVLELTWPRLDAEARQTAWSAWRTVRNANLGDGVATSPELVRRTAPAPFASPVAPAIVVPPRAFPAGASLAATLEEALRPFATAGSAVGGDRRLRVAVTFRTRMGEAGEGGAAPWSEVPVLLAPDALLAAGSAADPSGRAVTLRQLAAALAADADAWHAAAQPSTGTARLGLDVVLSAGADGARVPVVRSAGSEIEVPAGWWPPGNEPAGRLDGESRRG